MASTTGMRGGGFDDAHCSAQRAAMDASPLRIVDAVAAIPLSAGDFSGLLTNLSVEMTSPARHAGIDAAAIGRSLFDRVVPAGCLHVAMSFNAVDWLSALPPVPLPHPLDERFIFPVVYRSPEELLPLPQEDPTAAAFCVDPVDGRP